MSEQVIYILAVPDARGYEGARDGVEDLYARIPAGDADERVGSSRIA